MGTPVALGPMPVAERLPAAPAPWGFFKGLLTGVAIEIPVLAAAVWLLAREGIGNPDAGFIRIMRLTTVFAGVAALFTAGGIGRLAAYASAVGGRRRAMFVAARAHAVASGGLVVIAAIPLGHMPETSLGFIPIVIAGLIAGALCGALIGAVCGGAAPVGFADVWSLVRKPTDVLRQLLSPEDVVKLGSSLRTRTTHLFEGIFEPAAKRPTDGAKPEAGKPEAAKPEAGKPEPAQPPDPKPPAEAAKPADPTTPADPAKPKAE